MARDVTLTAEQAQIALAFMECFDLFGAGWPAIEEGMRHEFGIGDPESELEDVRNVLMGHT